MLLDVISDGQMKRLTSDRSLDLPRKISQFEAYGDIDLMPVLGRPVTIHVIYASPEGITYIASRQGW